MNLNLLASLIAISSLVISVSIGITSEMTPLEQTSSTQHLLQQETPLVSTPDNTTSSTNTPIAIANRNDTLFDIIDRRIPVINETIMIIISLTLVLYGIVTVCNGETSGMSLKLSLFFVGFVVSFVIAADILVLLEESFIFHPNSFKFFLIIVGGCVGGYAFSLDSGNANLKMGAAISWSFSLFAVCLISSLSNDPPSRAMKFFLILCIVAIGIKISSTFKGPIVVYGLLLFGSYAIFTGIDYFVASGFNQINFSFILYRGVPTTRNLWWMITLFVIVAFLSGVFHTTHITKIKVPLRAKEPRKKESNQSLGSINEKVSVEVIAQYQATRNDELDLEIGDIILTYETFDDGWAKGKNLSTSKTGNFPVICTKLIN